MTQQVSIDDIDAILPQTQCGQCGYNGCLPYAEALVNKGEKINRCPPGGVKGLLLLGKILNQDPTPYIEELRAKETPPQVAIIDENLCIGCMKCIQACPVDAIVGTSKRMHTVIESECSGCGLCVAPCPVDCIDMVTPARSEEMRSIVSKDRSNLTLRDEALAHPSSKQTDKRLADQYRRRFNARIKRLERKKIKKEKKFLTAKKTNELSSSEKRKAEIAAVLARAKAKKSSSYFCSEKNDHTG